MRIVYKRANKPISLAGCQQILEKAGILQSEYSTWSIERIFDVAEKLAKEQKITCQEIFIQPI